MTVSESLLQIAELTKQNLQILKVLNDSFYTKSNHLSTRVGDVTYTIPSYIALENKVNHVQDSINNLMHAAKSGEAWFNFDGNSKEICVRGYQSAPSPINLDEKKTFETEARQMFKDMLTPQPYLNFDMSNLPDDIHQVRVKKVIPYHTALISKLKEYVSDNHPTHSMDWATFQRILSLGEQEFVPGDDYLEYDTTYELPIRHCTRAGAYIIEEVLTDQITENFENVITVRISDQTPLVTTEFDGFGQKDLTANSVLTTFDGSAKLKVQKINVATRELELLIMSGEYVNPIAAGKDIKIQPNKTIFESVSDYSILKLHSSVETNRELHIPLEEDAMVFMTVAPVNPRLNIQSTWGSGLLVNADALKNAADDGAFRDYYNQNVVNIGDAMIELATVAYPSITKYNSTNWRLLMGKGSVKISSKDIHYNVVQINKHLNDSDAVKNIRALYSQKKQYQTDLAEVQARIASLTESLAEISFDDMSGTRSIYTAQISELKDQQNNLITSINKIVDNIALAANNAEIPLEEGKFRIRGYFDVRHLMTEMASGLGSTDKDLYKNILGIEVRYRYRNADIPQANVAVIDDFLFTEWCTYQPPYRERSMEYGTGKYNVVTSDNNDYNYSTNEPKFNQIDIPISQGENVEFQTRVIWGFGYPFVKTATEWSDTVTVTFPPELVKDVQVTTIIEENNSDIETNRFESILNTKGVTQHIDDAIDDQDVKFFHKPESISSGFYTPERRIIPLKDKLISIDSQLTEVTDMIQGTTSEALDVTCVIDNVAVSVQADVDNVIQLPAYSTIKPTDEQIPTGSAWRDSEFGVVYVPATIILKNKTNHTVNLFSVMPGSRDKYIAKLENHKYSLEDFVRVGDMKLGNVVVDETKQTKLGDIKFVDIKIGNTTFGDITIDSTKLRDTDLGGILLGDVRIYGMKFGDIKFDNPNLGNLKLGDVKIYGTPLSDIPLGNIEVGQGELGKVEVNGTKLGGLEINGTKLGGIKLGDVKINDKRFGDIQLGKMTIKELKGPVIVWSACNEDYDTGEKLKTPISASRPQRANQIITYRRINPYDGASYNNDLEYSCEDYEAGHNPETGLRNNADKGIWVWPITTSKYGMCLETDAVNAKLVLAPGESVSYALQIEYKLDANDYLSDKYTIGFNVRNSLYLDPLYYQIQFVAKNNQSTVDLLSSAKVSTRGTTKYNITVR